MWFSVAYSLIDNADTRHHSGQNLLRTYEAHRQRYASSQWSKFVADLRDASTTIRVITVVKMLWTHSAAPRESATNFDHCDDVYRCR